MSAEARPDVVPGLVARAELLTEAGRGEEGLGLVLAALAERSDDPRLHLTAAWICMQLQRSPEALDHAGRAVALAPDAAGTHLLLSGALLNVGDARRALAAVEQSLALDPDGAEAHAHHARLLLARRAGADDKRLARAASDRSLALSPDSPSLLLDAAGIRDQLGDTDGAKELVLRGLAVDPAHDDLLVAQAGLSDGTRGIGGVLAGNPLHAEARLLLHHRVWQQVTGLADLAVRIGTLSLLAVGWVMSDRGIGFAPVWAVVLLVLLGRGTVRGVRRLREAPGQYVARTLRQGGLPARAGAALGLVGLIGAVAVVVSLFVVADSVTARHLVVLAAAVVLVAGVSGTLLTPAVYRVARAEGLYPDSEQGLDRLVGQRRKLGSALLARGLVLVVLGGLVVLTLPAAGRTDALGPALLGASMFTLPVVAAWWQVDRILRPRPVPGRGAGPRGQGAIVLATVVVLGVGLAGLAQVPLGPNAHDEHGRYVRSSGAGNGSDGCGRASVLGCDGSDLPTSHDLRTRDVPPIDLPTLDFSDLDLDLDLDGDGAGPGADPASTPPAPPPAPTAP